jgi:ferritin
LTSLLSESLAEAIYQQISHESYNAALYQYISAYLKNKGLDSLAEKFEEQVFEEQYHAREFIKFLTDLSVDVEILAVPSVELQINTIKDIATIYLNREIETTESINSIKQLAIDESNALCEEFLRGMILKQQHEMEESTSFMDKVILMPEWWQWAIRDASIK